MIPGIVLIAALGLAVVLPAAVQAWRARKAARACEAETLVRLEEEGEADVEPKDVMKAIAKLVDVDGVQAVYKRPRSNLIVILAQPGATAAQLRALRDTVRWSTPIGLSAMVVSDTTGLPEDAMRVARSWPS